MGVPRLIGKEFIKFSFLLPGGRGSLQSGRTGDRELVSSLTQRDSSGQEEGEEGVLKGGIFLGGGERRKEKVNKIKENKRENL